MNINKIYSLAIAASLLTLGACSQLDDESAPESGGGENVKAMVAFSIDQAKTAATRAVGDGDPVYDSDTETETGGTTILAYDREKSINTTKVGAAIFQNNVFFRYVPSSLMTIDGADASSRTYYKFNLGSLGSYEMYVLINPSTTLETACGALTSGTSTVNDYFALTETTAPGVNDAATDFFMTSKKQQLDIDVSGTTMDGVIVTRAATRIDIDATKLTTAMGSAFIIEEVIYHNRYTETKINHTEDPLSTAGLARNQEDTDGDSTPDAYQLTYTKDDAGMSSTISTGTDVWQGVLYGYENFTESATDADYLDADAAIAAGITVITVKGKYANGIQMAHDIIFPKAIKPTRNHLYSISLEPLDIATDYGMVTHSIRVKDWDTGETVGFSVQNLLSNPVQPDFELSSTSAAVVPDVASNFTTLTVTDIAAAEAITVKVTNHRGTAAKLFCVDDDLTDNELPEGITITENVGAREFTQDSKLIQYFTITVDPLAVGATGPTTYTIVVEDYLNDSAAAKRQFTLTNEKTSY